MSRADAPPGLPPRRFLADRMLSRLARWLRLAGEDVLAPALPGSHEPPRAELYRLARTESRIVLTRDRGFPGLKGERLLLVATDLDEQLLEFFSAFPGDPLARAFTRCTACNGPAPEVPREAVLAELPPQVWERGRDFRRCSQCGHVYWEGSHSHRIRDRLIKVREALRRPGRTMDAARASLPPTLAPDDQRGWARFDDFLRLLFARLDLSWSGYRRPRRSLRAPIIRRMSELGLRDYGQYLDYLDANFAEEKGRLTEILTVTVSRFFRDREDWAELARVAFPELARLGRPIGALSLGCASGEEPYTLRLLWDQPVPLIVDAFDVREDLLARAREAVYGPSSVHSVPPAILERCFAREGTGYRLDPAVAASVRFARHDFFHDPLGGPYDLILCRNVAFTYLDVGRQVEMACRLARAMAPGGFLMIGGKERLPEGSGPEGLELQRWGRCLYRAPIQL